MKTLILTDAEHDALIATINDLICRFEYNDNGPDSYVCDFCGRWIPLDITHSSDCQVISLLDKLNALK
jgi:hypothetical protein